MVVKGREQEVEKQFMTATMPRTRSANYISAYANNTHASSTFWDLRLFFGEIVLIPGPELEAHIEDHACIAMSWEHAKSLRKLLERMIVKYEKDNSIRDQPETVEGTV